jgi:hypothetical protein
MGIRKARLIADVTFGSYDMYRFDAIDTEHTGSELGRILFTNRQPSMTLNPLLNSGLYR